MRPSLVARAAVVLAASSLLAASPPASKDDVTATLRRQTQEMFDALAGGKTEVWDRYVDDAAVQTAEDGSVTEGKKAIVGQIRPLPAGVSGEIVVQDFVARMHGDIAVATWVADEKEHYHGQDLHCQYRATDTWRKGKDGWRLIAEQVLALKTDPPAVELPKEKLAEYVGKYQLLPSPDVGYEIRLDNGVLQGAQTGRKMEAMRAEATDVLFVPGRPRYRFFIQRGADGKVAKLVERREAWDLVWTRVP
jgi:ketosteroid isomerase-like protein